VHSVAGEGADWPTGYTVAGGEPIGVMSKVKRRTG
jgi:hypothetical protein